MSELSFWDVHGIIGGLALGFLLAFLPRITTLVLVIVTTMVSGGFFWWLGWLIFPHFLVAGLATLKYWDTNPILVIMAWMWAFLGTGVEGKAASSGRRVDD